ncbi:MAG: lytic transglycosylase [Hyphobacterium sp.]|nr:MAG: lytic transglycosylase [Hyphobacterium sp.]
MSTISPPGEATHALIARASRETGANFEFMVRTAARESNFDPNAQATTSSAAGMYQFLDQTWLAMVSRHGGDHGLSTEADLIEQSESGRYAVSDPAERQRILDMRFDASVAARMAGELAAENASILEARIGRQPTSGELYAAHFLGAGGASDLINAASSDPTSRADQLFPAAARANRNVFYVGGRPRNVQDVLAGLTREEAVTAPDRVIPSRLPNGDAPSLRFHSPTQDQAIAFTSRRVGLSNGGGTLSPAVVAILASLDVPRGRDERES